MGYDPWYTAKDTGETVDLAPSGASQGQYLDTGLYRGYNFHQRDRCSTVVYMAGCSFEYPPCEDGTPTDYGNCTRGRTLRVYEGAALCLCPDSPRMKDSK